jgi:hypothetical protein
MSNREPTLTDVLAAVTALDGKVDAGLVKLRTELSERIDRVQNDVTLMKHEMEVHYGHVDEYLAWTRGLLEATPALSREIGGLFKMVKHLQSEIEELKKKPQA